MMRRLLRAVLVGSIGTQILEAAPPTSSNIVAEWALPETPPQLNGRHLDITIVETSGFVDIVEDQYGDFTHSGFFIEVLKALAGPDRANFTYTLKTPSGYGSMCESIPPEPYPRVYHSHFSCGQSDVTDLPHTNHTTDMYVGAFYITPKRRKFNRFTIPLYPPTTGTQTMVGTATNVRDFDDFLKQQEAGKQGPACVLANTAYSIFIRETFPTMRLVEIEPTKWFEPIDEGICDVLILGHPFAARFVMQLSKANQCLANGKPIGLVGDPLGFGLNYFGFGIRKDLPLEIVDTLDYWLLDLMTCPSSTVCPDDSLSVLFRETVGTGRECNYVQFPTSGHGLGPKPVSFIVIAAVGFVVAVSCILYRIKLKQQEKRFRKRFVQQIARNISIGPSPSCIPVEKLAEEVQHIGNSEGTITKEELLKWMLDVKLEFISDRDFDALWSAMDMDNKGAVNAIDFFVFLSACGSQFEEVYQEQLAMPKKERLKLAARRLSNINKIGEEGVRALQIRLERNTRSKRGPSLKKSANVGSFDAPSQLGNSAALWDQSSEFCRPDHFDESEEWTTRESNDSTVDA